MVTASPDLAPDPAGNDEDLALIRQLAALPPLPVPPGLTSRIVRDVPRLAQLPARGRVAGGAAGGVAVWSRLLAPMASLAAGVAVFALVLPRGAPVAAVSVPARAATTARPVALPPADAAAAAPLADATVRAASLRQRPALRRAVAPQADAPALVLADKSAAPAPAGQTAAASVVPAAAGPVDLAMQTAGPAATGPQAWPQTGPQTGPLGAHAGLMGPTLPQGYGFAGGAGSARGEFGTPAGAGMPDVGPAILPGGRPH